MTQSVELLLDASADAEIRAQWDRLGDAGLPTARRAEPSPHHAPHLTLWAGDTVSAETDAALKPMRLFHWSNSYLALVFVAAAIDPLVF